MYFMLMCQSPPNAERAMFSYDPDRLRNGLRRLWNTGVRFEEPPQEPIRVEIEPGESGVLLEFSSNLIPLMTHRLSNVLKESGVSNIDFYNAEICELETGKIYVTHVVFNLIGVLAAADLTKSEYQAYDSPLISVDFDSLAIDENKTRGALMFRLAESVNGIVIHESVKSAIEAAGIDTLTFIPPEEWVG